MSHGPSVGLQQQYSAAPRSHGSTASNSTPSAFSINMGATSAKSEEEKEEEDDDDDMGYGLFDDAPAAPKAAMSVSPLHGLISLQTFSGAWEWNDDLFAVVGKKLEFDAAFVSEQFMATSLAVAYLEARLADSKDVWEMVVEKAKTWMGSQIGEDVVDGLIEKAKRLL